MAMQYKSTRVINQPLNDEYDHKKITTDLFERIDRLQSIFLLWGQRTLNMVSQFSHLDFDIIC